MIDYSCHLCGEAMEADTLLAQGDTCDACYFASVPPQTADTYTPPMELMIGALLLDLSEAQ